MAADPSLEVELREAEIRSSLRSPELHGTERIRLLRTAPRAAGADHVHHAFRALYFAFIAIPFAAGVDKFSNVLVDWSRYLAPIFPNTFGVTPREFMYGVGLLEMIVGIGVAVKPKLFAYIASIWLFAIVVNLLSQQTFFDIAVRDFGLALGAFALGKLAQVRDWRIYS